MKFHSFACTNLVSFDCESFQRCRIASVVDLKVKRDPFEIKIVELSAQQRVHRNGNRASRKLQCLAAAETALKHDRILVLKFNTSVDRDGRIADRAFLCD